MGPLIRGLFFTMAIEHALSIWNREDVGFFKLNYVTGHSIMKIYKERFHIVNNGLSLLWLVKIVYSLALKRF
jgi:hypothetical protein